MLTEEVDRRMFIDEQASLDLAVGALREGHTWESLRDAIQRVEGFAPDCRLRSVKVFGLTLD